MIRVVIAASSFNAQSHACLDLVKKAYDGPLHSVVFLDLATIQNVKSVEATHSIDHADVTYVHWSEWSNNGVPDRQAIRLSVKSISVNSTIVVDSTDCPHSMVLAILLECHRVWFQLDEWPRAFVLICDDTVAHRSLNEISKLFCIPSESVSDEVMGRTVRKILRRASLVRWFGFGKITKTIKLIASLKSRLYKKLSPDG